MAYWGGKRLSECAQLRRKRTKINRKWSVESSEGMCGRGKGGKRGQIKEDEVGWGVREAIAHTYKVFAYGIFGFILSVMGNHWE